MWVQVHMKVQSQHQLSFLSSSLLFIPESWSLAETEAHWTYWGGCPISPPSSTVVVAHDFLFYFPANNMGKFPLQQRPTENQNQSECRVLEPSPKGHSYKTLLHLSLREHWKRSCKDCKRQRIGEFCENVSPRNGKRYIHKFSPNMCWTGIMPIDMLEWAGKVSLLKQSLRSQAQILLLSWQAFYWLSQAPQPQP